MTDIDKSLLILQKTDDGNDLAPEQLYLIQTAVNGWLTDEGKKAFQELFEEVDSGHYRKPWFHDIEHLTIDHTGYVYWKGEHVEHYTLSWAYSEEAGESAKELAKRCRHLESIGVKPSATSAVWGWEKYARKTSTNK